MVTQSAKTIRLAKEIIAFDNGEDRDPPKSCRWCNGTGKHSQKYCDAYCGRWTGDPAVRTVDHKPGTRKCHCVKRNGNLRKHCKELVDMAKIYLAWIDYRI